MYRYRKNLESYVKKKPSTNQVDPESNEFSSFTRRSENNNDNKERTFLSFHCAALDFFTVK